MVEQNKPNPDRSAFDFGAPRTTGKTIVSWSGLQRGNFLYHF
jgi:hypothetical protein